MRPEIRRALVATFVARTAASAGLRVVYPFLPALARGLGVTPGQLSAVIAIRNLGGFGTPVVARLAERHGRRSIMLVAIAAVTAGCLLVVTGWFALAAAGIVVVGFAKYAFDISMQSWFGDRVPYTERGRVFGITELTWATSLVVAAPVSGFLIAATDWRAPFVLVALLSLAGLGAVARGVAPDRPAEHRPVRLEASGRLLRVVPIVVLFIASSEVVFVLYGQWLEGNFGLSVTGIGTFSLLRVVGELSGEGAVAAFSDRIGLKRMWLGGLLVTSVAYFSFGLVGSSLVMAMIVVVVWISAFEVTIVSAIPFIIELSPARERILSTMQVSISSGRVLGAIAAQPLFQSGGIELAAAVAGTSVLAAALLLARGVPDHTPPNSTPSL
jgi:predicted MFS family arabinose efflux permease